MIEWITSIWTSVMSAPDSNSFVSTVDSVILVCAVLPAFYLYSKFLFGDVSRARQLAKSPRVLGWLFFFCALEILLHLMKAPIVWKVVVVVIAIVAFPFVVLSR
jgi:hypothetical protein